MSHRLLPSFILHSLLVLAALGAGAAPAGATLSTDTPWIAHGEATNDDFGYAIASAGDFNGDGYEDWIVGAPSNDAGGNSSGAAQIFFGGPGADATPDLTLVGAAAGDEFGTAVAGIGDFNADGYDDVLVGAPFNDAVANAAGRAYVFYGGAYPDAAADLVLNGDQADDNYGRVLSAGGDLNADGYPDFLVAGKYLAGLTQDNGRVEVFFGGPSPSSSPYFDFFGEDPGDYLGYSIAPVGDYNGDGFDDVVVGAPFYDDTGGNEGRAYLYFGGYDFDQYYDLAFTGISPDDLFGYRVSGGGDFNGDGFGDMAVTAIANDAGGSNAGTVYLYLGYDPPNISIDLELHGDEQGGYFGDAVVGPIDLNGDGYGDFVVSAPTTGNLSDMPSQLKVYLGSAGINNQPDLVVQAESAAELGRGLAAAGDLDDDGRRDLLVGAPGAGAGGQARIQSVFPFRVRSPNGGETWIAGEASRVEWLGPDLADVELSLDGGMSWSLIQGGAGGDESNSIKVVAPFVASETAMVRVTATGEPPSLKCSDMGDARFRIVEPHVPPVAATTLEMDLLGEAAGDYLGYSVASVGDVNADGYEDFVAGAPYNDAGGNSAGRAYLHFGGPGLDDKADLVFTGATSADGMGDRVAGGGDFDGDGFDDLVVAAPYEDTVGPTAGAVYVYRGGPDLDNLADFTFFAETAEDQLGASVAMAGDVNGDGADDIVVGADLSGANGTQSGRAYVYFGGLGADGIPDLVMTGEAALDHFGEAVAGVGDLNGDGFDDFAVGAAGSDASGNLAGRAYVYLGGAEPDTSADLVLDGWTAATNFGCSVAGAGDVDGDGYDDFLVGAYGDDISGLNGGAAYLYRGGARLDGVADLVLEAEVPGDGFGITVSGGRDFNGDGYDDMVVGAGDNDAGGSGSGRVYVYFGSPLPDRHADLVYTGEDAGEKSGTAVAAAGDIDGDGHPDLLVGARYSDLNGSNAGRVYVRSLYPYRVLFPNGGEKLISGGPVPVRWRGRAPADVSLSRDGGESWATLLQAAGGQENNRVELALIGEPGDRMRLRVCRTGEAPVLANTDQSDGDFTLVPPSRPVAHAPRIAPTGSEPSDNLGRVVSGAGDVNGDGFDDLIAGAVYNDLGGTSAGAAFVYFGGPHADDAPDMTLVGEAAEDRLGASVGGAGDFNGDGYDDVVVGATHNDAGGVNAGRAYVYFGGPAGDVVADLILTGEAAGDYFGTSVSGGGDVNGDGFADVIVGACYNDGAGSNFGRVYVYFGGSAPDATADWILDGEAVDNRFGYAASNAGDVNGDGFDDVIVGAYTHDGAGTDEGRVYVFFGSPTPDGNAELVLDGEADSDWLGYAVGAAGDVNGDGYGDVIAGAKNNDAAGSNAGRAYLYYGGPLADSAPDLVLTGAVAEDNFGVGVNGAGDVNGDGFDDVIVGASYNDAAATNAGRAYIYFGGPGMDAVADAEISGDAGGDYLGQSVAGVGDMDGDGFDDVAAGALGDDTGATDAGRVFVCGFNRYWVSSPGAGGTWNVGANEMIRWLGAEPADLWLSVDGGNSYALLRSNVGGGARNTVSLTVPHQPTRFAKVRVSPHDDSVAGAAETDSLFTIEASIALLNLKAAPFDGGGVLLSWETDPGPEDLAGYRIERADSGDDWRTVVGLTRETQYHDVSASAGMSYRLFGVNGLGEELMLGETALAPRAALAAWPLPYRGGKLMISFLTAGGLGGAAAPGEVALFDLQGRRVRTLARGLYGSGFETADWDGRDEAGRPVASGIYFLKAVSGGETTRIKLVVVR